MGVELVQLMAQVFEWVGLLWRGWLRGGCLDAAVVLSPLVFDKHVEKLIPWLLGVPIASEVPHVVEGDAKPRQAAYASPLVIQPAALGAGNEVKELFSLW